MYKAKIFMDVIILGVRASDFLLYIVSFWGCLYVTNQGHVAWEWTARTIIGNSTTFQQFVPSPSFQIQSLQTLTPQRDPRLLWYVYTGFNVLWSVNSFGLRYMYNVQCGSTHVVCAHNPTLFDKFPLIILESLASIYRSCIAVTTRQLLSGNWLVW